MSRVADVAPTRGSTCRWGMRYGVTSDQSEDALLPLVLTTDPQPHGVYMANPIVVPYRDLLDGLIGRLTVEVEVDRGCRVAHLGRCEV